MFGMSSAVIQYFTLHLPVTRCWSFSAVCSVMYLEPVKISEDGSLTPLVLKATVTQQVESGEPLSLLWSSGYDAKSDHLRLSEHCKICATGPC